MSWMDAQNYCREHFTDLAIPRNLSENEKIRAVIPAGVYGWISLFRTTWKWSGGPMYVFQRWIGGQPDGGTGTCGATKFDRSGYWADWSCDIRKPFICHHDSVPFTKQVVKVKLVGNSALDLNDPAVLENLQEELKQKVRENGVDAEIRLSWKKQVDGKIFYQEKEEEDQK
ncbi:putative C-type lectin domain family 20 member A [Fundulus heteroclitus]|uniref:putative C-type lectin domain family 20 member A n=1 Tax=Fundulus heteroclitus TaxID=8078 RepID=UPI00165B198A|nr:putative C-type lectin domain family 20 member A [Fundulus heteroclitus]